MKKLAELLLLLCCLASAALPAREVVELSQGAEKIIPSEKGVPRSEVLSFGTLPAEARTAEGGLLIGWNPAESRYIEVRFKQPLLLPEFSTAAVTGRVFAPVGSPVTKLGLRLQDVGGEVFQLGLPVDFKSGGWFDVKWELIPGNLKESWGTNVNKRLDHPVQILGFGVDYGQGASGEAAFFLTELGATLSGGPAEAAVTSLYRFGHDQKFVENWGSGELLPGNDGLLIRELKGKKNLSEYSDPLRFYNNAPERLTLDAELLSGRATVMFQLIDAENKKYDSAIKLLESGRNQLKFELEELMNGAKLPFRVSSITFEATPEEPASILLRSADLALNKPLIEAVDFNIETGNPVHVLRDGEEQALEFLFTNTTGRSGRFTFNLEFQDYAGRKFEESFSAKIDGGETFTYLPKWRPDAYGHWWVEALVSEADVPGRSAKVRRSFAYLTPAGPTAERAPGFLFSVCTHSERWSYGDQEREITAAAFCGAKVVRTGVTWAGLQPEEGVFRWKLMDRLVSEYGRMGMELQMLLAYSVPWAQTEGTAQPRIDAWQEYSRAVADRYRGRIRYYEVWNEPDLGGANPMAVEEYVELQKASYEAIKSVDPDAFVMSGGFATLGEHAGRKDKEFHRKFLTQAKGFFEVHAYHEHGTFQDYEALIREKFEPMRAETGTTMPWYANETAITSAGGSEKRQAETLFKKLLYAWSRGAIGYTWYDLRNDGFDPLDAEQNYGMLTNDFYPKPVYSVFNQLARRFRSSEFVKRLDVGPNLWMFLFVGPDGVRIPGWDESGFSSTQALVIRSEAREAFSVDLMDNARPLEILDGMVLVEVNARPSTVELLGATTAEPVGTLLTMDSGSVAVPGKSFRFLVRLYNPLGVTKNFTLALASLPDGFSCNTMRKTVTVKPGARVVTDFLVNVASDFKAEYGSAGAIKVAYQVSDSGWQGTATLMVNSAVSVPPGDFNRDPDFVINRAEQVVSLVDADPANTSRLWGGPSDLSAVVWLGENNGELLMHAMVTDDKHVQPEEGFSIWKGDSMLLSFQIPGQIGSWEIGLAALDSGKSELFVFQTPTGFNAESVMKGLKLYAFRAGDKTTYQLTIPEWVIGTNRYILSKGFRFNLMINENDGEGRDGWMHIAPGIGSNKNPDKFPFVVFEE